MLLAAAPLTMAARSWRRFFLRATVFLRTAVLKAVVEVFESSASRQRLASCLHSPEFATTTGSNKWCSMLTCSRALGGCGAIVVYEPTTAALESRRRRKAKGKEKSFLDEASRVALDSSSGPPSCKRCESAMIKYDPQPGKVDARWKCTRWPECRVLYPLVASTSSSSSRAERATAATSASASSAAAATQDLSPQEMLKQFTSMLEILKRGGPSAQRRETASPAVEKLNRYLLERMTSLEAELEAVRAAASLEGVPTYHLPTADWTMEGTEEEPLPFPDAGGEDL